MKTKPDPLLDELGRLPALRASAGFTERLLRRLDTPASNPGASPTRLAWGALGASLAMIVILAVLPDRSPSDDPNLSNEAREIRRQHALLTQELNQLRSRTQEVAPVLYLGSDDEVDYVLDLSPFLLPQTAGALPASPESSSSTF